MTLTVALVTGANRGIGYEIARQLCDQGIQVWLGCRDRERGKEAAQSIRDKGGDARFVELDVTSDGSVDLAAKQVRAETPSLDILVNNAGMNFGPPPEASAENLDQIAAMFETNSLGPLRVTQAFLPLLRASKLAKIVMISSGLGSHELTLDPTSENWGVGFAGYCASKSALNMLSLKLAKELLPEGIKVNIVDPGLTSTDLGGHQGRGPEESAKVAVALATIDAFGPTAGFFHDNQAYRHKQHPW